MSVRYFSHCVCDILHKLPSRLVTTRNILACALNYYYHDPNIFGEIMIGTRLPTLKAQWNADCVFPRGVLTKLRWRGVQTDQWEKSVPSRPLLSAQVQNNADACRAIP